jgi:hypothetical protein
MHPNVGKNAYLYGMLVVFLLAVLVVLIAHGRKPEKPAAASQKPAMPAVLPATSTRQNPVDFIRERVALEVFGDSVTVAGTYWFRVNDSSVQRLPILYPFPVDETAEYPSHIELVNSDGKPIEFRDSRESSSIRLVMDLNAPPEFTVTYTQHLARPEARYILTTTAAWQKPLEHAEFIVSLPERYTMTSLSYDYDTNKLENGRRIYTFSRDNFMPDHDITVQWTY